MINNLDTNRKHRCNFILVNNTNLCAISQLFQLLHSICQVIDFDKGMPLVNTFVLVNLFGFSP